MSVSLSGQEFNRAAKAQKLMPGFTGCGKTPSVKWFVSGHEFTRAAKAAESTSGFSPC
jgi:hypothetical protein